MGCVGKDEGMKKNQSKSVDDMLNFLLKTKTFLSLMQDVETDGLLEKFLKTKNVRMQLELMDPQK